jgi:hypothetical protein
MTLRDISPASAGGVDAQSTRTRAILRRPRAQSLPSLFVRAISRTA